LLPEAPAPEGIALLSGAQQIFGSIRDQQLYRKDQMPAGLPLTRSLFPASGGAVVTPAGCSPSFPLKSVRSRGGQSPLLTIGGVVPAGPPKWHPPPVPLTVTGGQAMEDTLNGFNRLAETTTWKNVIVWLNEYFGEVSKDGKSFEEFRVAEEQAAKLLGTVVIRERNPNTYGDDMRQMLSKRLTFEEAIRLAEFSLVSKQRLTIIRRELFEQLDRIEME
jgi:hypothetical protein